MSPCFGLPWLLGQWRVGITEVREYSKQEHPCVVNRQASFSTGIQGHLCIESLHTVTIPAPTVSVVTECTYSTVVAPTVIIALGIADNHYSQMCFGDSESTTARAVRTWFELLCKFWESYGQDQPLAPNPSLGCGKLARSAKSMFTKPSPPSVPRFPQVRSHRSSNPIRTLIKGTFRSQGLTFKNTLCSAFSGKTPGLLARGFTPEFKEQFLKDFTRWNSDVIVYSLCLGAEFGLKFHLHFER